MSADQAYRQNLLRFLGVLQKAMRSEDSKMSDFSRENPLHLMRGKTEKGTGLKGGTTCPHPIQDCSVKLFDSLQGTAMSFITSL